MPNFRATCMVLANEPLPTSSNQANVVYLTLRSRYVFPFVPDIPSYSLPKGVRQIKTTDLNPIYCFISPPSLSALRDRLVGRGTETTAAVEKRLKTALLEMEYARLAGAHDHIIVNDDLERAYTLFKSVAFGHPVSSDPLPPPEDLSSP
jgi:hypothetical protein